MKKLIKSVKARFARKHKKELVHKDHVEHVSEEISDVRLEFRKKFYKLQKSQLKTKIISELASLKDRVNVEKILTDLGEKYILRSDLKDVMLDTNYDSDPVLLLRFSRESAGSKEEVDRFVSLVQYSA